MSESKNMKIVYGPVYPVVEKTEIIKIPSERAGEKKIVRHLDLQKEWEQFLDIQANKHVSEMGKDGVIRRIREDGKVLTQKEAIQEEKEDKGVENDI